MSKDLLDPFREQYGFAEWTGTGQSGYDRELHELALPRGLVANLDPQQVRSIEVGDGTRLLRASWPASDDDGSVLTMDIRECPSRQAAHEVLLELLANMQSPHVRRLEGDGPGDIAFAHNPGALLIFARGNIAVKIANGGSRTISAAEIAQEVDAWLVSGAGLQPPLPSEPTAA